MSLNQIMHAWLVVINLNDMSLLASGYSRRVLVNLKDLSLAGHFELLVLLYPSTALH